MLAEVARLEHRQLAQIQVPAQRGLHLGRRQRGDAPLEILVPREGAAEVGVVEQATREEAVLAARQAARLQQSVLRTRELGLAEALRERALELLPDRALDPVAVLRRVDRRDVEAGGVVERTRAEAAEDAVG